MKKILIFICLFVSVKMFSQNIPGYNTRTVRERLIAMAIDSGLHIPRYNGAPSGLRVGVYVADGQIAMDTTNHRLYIYSGGSWLGLAKFTELSTASRFGIEDITLGQNRAVSGLNNTYGLQLDSVNQFSVWRNGISRMFMNSSQSGLASPDGLSSLFATNAMVSLDFNSSGNYLRMINDSSILHKRISYEGNIHSTLNPNSLVDKSYVDSAIAAGGGTPTFQQTLDVETGEALTTKADTINNSTFDFYFRSTTATNNGLRVLQRSTTGQGKANILPGTVEFEAADYPDFNETSYFTMNRGDNAGLWAYALDNDGRTKTLNWKLYPDSLYIHPNTTDQFNFIVKGIPNKSIAGTDSILIHDIDGKVWKAPTTDIGGGISAANLPLRITGSTVSADTSVAYDPSLTTNKRTQKILDSLQAAGWGNTFNINSEHNYQVYMDASGSTQAGMFISSIGTGSSQARLATPIADNWMGTLETQTGTTTTGLAYMHFGNGGVINGIALDNSYRYNWGTKIRLEDLSDGTDTYHVLAGYSDHNNDDASTVDGVWFSYTHSASSGQWVCNTRSNSVSTTTASGTTVAADTDYELEISVFNGNAYFYINKSLVATISTNIPTGTARATSIACAIRKSAGTNSRKMYYEWLAYGKRSN